MESGKLLLSRFDKKVTLIEKVEINTKPYPIGKVNPRTESIQYNYPDSLPSNSTVKLSPPVFVNDTIDLKKYLLDNIRYPVITIENNIQGTLSAAFTVNPDRSITNLKIVKNIDLFLEKSVIHTLRRMNGMWKAGTANGKEIPVEMVIDVEFKLIKQ